MQSYSQYGEDLVVRSLVAGTGRVLDIGAWHPTTFSNSRLLIDDGWEALLVEFSPTPVRTLVAAYADNPRVRVVQAAVSTGEGGMREYDVTDDGLSTCTPEIREKWNEKGGYYGKLWVAQLPLRALLEQFGGDFTVVSFDAEGTSVDLAAHYLRDLQQLPQVLVVEHDDRIVEIMTVAQERGYRLVHANGTNVVLAR